MYAPEDAASLPFLNRSPRLEYEEESNLKDRHNRVVRMHRDHHKIATFEGGVKVVPDQSEMRIRNPLLSRHCQELKTFLNRG
jgi:hypothetical protein